MLIGSLWMRSFNNIIYKGQTTVSNGEFSINFIIPVDINYQVGRTKISYYAISDDGYDASGSFDNLFIGGTSSTPIVDTEGPIIMAFLNDGPNQSL